MEMNPKSAMLLLLYVLALALAPHVCAICPYGEHLKRPSPITNATQLQSASDADLRRAGLRRPLNDNLLAPKTKTVSETINSWLLTHIPVTNLKKCDEFTVNELNVLLSSMVQSANPELNQIYSDRCTPNGRCDSRKLRHDKLSNYEAEWEEEQANLPWHSPDALNLIRDGKCYEAVSMFYHHLVQTSRDMAVSNGLMLPLLPEHLLERARRSTGHYRGESQIPSPSQNAADVLQALEVYNQTVIAEMGGINEWNRIVERYNGQSPCQISHTNHTIPRNGQFQSGTLFNNGYNPGADTTINQAQTGYVDCTTFTCGASDVPGTSVKKYYMRAVIKNITIRGSRRINPNNDSADFVFQTRTFEPIPEKMNLSSPYYQGLTGNGDESVLGPAFLVNPGDTLWLLLENDLQSELGNVPLNNTAIVNRINILRNATQILHNDTIGYLRNLSYMGAEWPNSSGILQGQNVPAEDLVFPGGNENVPGNFTQGFNKFNIHLHGFETQPHLFHPLGTSNNSAPWIQIEPTECYCYKFNIAPTMSRGLFLYHTHMHGTTSMLTWSGLFGIAVVGEMSVSKARRDLINGNGFPRANYSLVHDLVLFADGKGIPFDDLDMKVFVMYDTSWNLIDPNSNLVQLTDFYEATRGVANFTPVLVNNEYQPQIPAKKGHLTVFQIACISAGNLCTFQIEFDVNETYSVPLGFYRLASDGISYLRPVIRQNGENISNYIPDVDNATAYLSMGGGMRETIALVFECSGNYSIWQRVSAFDDGINQLVATVNVTTDIHIQGSHHEGVGVESSCQYDNTTSSGLEEVTLQSGRASIRGRTVIRERDLTFAEGYRQDSNPFLQYGISTNQSAFEMYNLTQINMAGIGGQCEIWTIRSPNIFAHPFHIHVNPFMVLDVVSDLQNQDGLKTVFQQYHFPWVSPPFGANMDGIWRDTVIIPPFGYVRIMQCYDAGEPRPDLRVDTFGGKLIFHCHFLDHEDTGLVHNFMLTSETVDPENISFPNNNDDDGTETAVIVVVVVVVFLAIAIFMYYQTKKNYTLASTEPGQSHQTLQTTEL